MLRAAPRGRQDEVAPTHTTPASGNRSLAIANGSSQGDQKDAPLRVPLHQLQKTPHHPHAPCQRGGGRRLRPGPHHRPRPHRGRGHRSATAQPDGGRAHRARVVRRPAGRARAAREPSGGDLGDAGGRRGRNARPAGVRDRRRSAMSSPAKKSGPEEHTRRGSRMSAVFENARSEQAQKKIPLLADADFNRIFARHDGRSHAPGGPCRGARARPCAAAG